MHKKKDDILSCGILIVEDDPVGRLVLKEIFRKHGFTRIAEAGNGREGLEKLRDFRPELVVLDVIMPEMDGIECCARIRADADPRISSMPVLFQTSLDGVADKARLFAAGATDYLTKPVDSHEIAARAVVHLEREVMTRRLREFNARLRHELDIARDTQRVLMPDAGSIAETEKECGLRISGHYQPSSELGGDFWGFKRLPGEALAVYSVDFSGHGVNAALNVFRLHSLMQAAMDAAHLPGAYLSRLNAVLAPLLPPGQFATMFYGVIDKGKNTLAYASAAAPAPLLFTRRGMEYRTLENAGSLLGAFEDSAYETRETPFAPGDCLLLYSDALTETEDEGGNMLTLEEAADIFRSRLAGGCSESMEALLAHFQARFAPRLADDLTLSAYCRHPAS